jgi:hypothetical protein
MLSRKKFTQFSKSPHTGCLLRKKTAKHPKLGENIKQLDKLKLGSI